MDKKLISDAVKGTEDAKALLRQAGISTLQRKAAIDYITDAAPPISIEDYWRDSPYSKKKYPVRFVARVVSLWLDSYVKTYSIAPNERDELDNRLYALLEKRTWE